MRLNGISLFLSISHSILLISLSLSPEKLAMIVVYRQKSGSQRFKPEERLLPAACYLLLLLLLPTTETARKSKNGRMDGWMEWRWHVDNFLRVCVWWVGGLVGG